MSRVLTLLTWALAALATALLVVLIVIPRLTGWVPLTVLSGSMEPAIPTGSMVAVERIQGEADLERIDVGDVITFMPRPQDPTLVTHRVISQGALADGGTVFVTQGDANQSPDPAPVDARQIRGKVRYHVPYAGYLSDVLNTGQKRTGVVIVAGVLFVYAARQALIAARGTTGRAGEDRQRDATTQPVNDRTSETRAAQPHTPTSSI